MLSLLIVEGAQTLHIVDFGPGSSVLYYVAGMMMSDMLLKLDVAKKPRFWRAALLSCVCLTVGLRTIWFFLGNNLSNPGLTVINNLSFVAQFFAVLLAFACFPRRMNGLVTNRGLTFLVYCLHYPIVLRIVSVCPGSANGIWYLAIGLMSFAGCLALLLLLNVGDGRLLRMLGGGR